MTNKKLNNLEEKLIENMEKEYNKRLYLSLERETITNKKIIESKKPLTNLFGKCPYCGNRFYYPNKNSDYEKKCSECEKIYI
jgi:hypothetical protein